MSPAAIVPNALLTYLLHSTVLVAVAWLGDRLLARDALAIRQALWRTALVGGIVTASLQVGFGVQPAGGSWGFHRSEAAAAPMMAATALPSVSPALLGPAAGGPEKRPVPWIALWLGGATLAALPFAFAYRRFRIAIADRCPVVDDVFDRLRHVQSASGAHFPVRLSRCERLDVPIAFGFTEPEICLPARGLQALTPEQLDGLLSHELAHLVRSDPLWLILDRLVSAAFFFQPLNWLACRRLRALSEMACDSWAVAAIGDPVALAGCLTEVATWRRTAVQPVWAPAIGGLRSHLGQRVERLLDGTAASAHRRRGTRGWLLALAVTAAVAWLAPEVSLADKPAERQVEKKIVVLDDEPEPPAEPPAQPPDEPPPPPPPHSRPRRPLPPVQAKPMAPQGRAAVAPPPQPDDVDTDVDADTPEPVMERDIERHARAMAEDASRMAEHVTRDVRPDVEALRHDIERTVQLALAKARLELDRAAREVAQGHQGLEDAHRQIERERQSLREERRQLEEERRQLQEEREQLRHEGGS